MTKSIEIKKFVKERQIQSLFHFTRYDNLESILSKGLLTREACTKALLNKYRQSIHKGC